MRSLILLTVFGAISAQPATASPPGQTPTAQSAPTAQADPQRLALGREIAGALCPDGTMQKMMSSMADVQSGMMGEVMNASPKDFGAKGKDSDKTLSQLMREKDPYFEERMAITNRIMMEEMGKILGGFEPQFRESLAQIYARRFTLAELTDIAAFFKTPSGKSYASQMMSVMSDPSFAKAMSAVMPKLMQAMPGIAEKIKQATAHLPPPPKDDQKAKPAASPTT